MANDDEDDEPIWDPKEEKAKTDPRALIKLYAEEMRKVISEGGSVLGGPVPQAYAPHLPADLQLAVHPISNGFLVVCGRSIPGYHPGEGASGRVEEFAADQAAVHAILLRALREFFAAFPAPSTSSGAPGSNQP